MVAYVSADGAKAYDSIMWIRETPLNLAMGYRSSADSYALGSVLLAAGADPELTDTNGATALYAAIGAEATEFALRLIREGVTLNSQTLWYIDADEGTPLWLASRRGNLPVVKALLHAGAEIDLESQWGYTPLAQAVVEGHYTIARALLRASASPNGSTRRDLQSGEPVAWQPLASAFDRSGDSYKREDLIDLLIEAGGAAGGCRHC